MADRQVARRYAQAAFELARQEGDLPGWRRELDDVATVFVDSDAAPVFADGRIPLPERFAFAERVLDVRPAVVNLAKLLIQKGRTGEAREIANVFGEMVDEAEGIAHARITTAVDLSPEQVAEVEQALSRAYDKRIIGHASVDPDLLGGIVLRIGDRLIDGSVRTRLKLLRDELKGAR
ncbi:MAG: ATP synthase F1 subunit delta [Dehalococcoidia bacterium]